MGHPVSQHAPPGLRPQCAPGPGVSAAVCAADADWASGAALQKLQPSHYLQALHEGVKPGGQALLRPALRAACAQRSAVRELQAFQISSAVPVSPGCAWPAARALNSVVMELRKCCNHAFLLDGAEDAAQASLAGLSPLDKLLAASGKLTLLDAMLTRLIAQGHRTLVYSQFTRVRQGRTWPALPRRSGWLSVCATHHTRLAAATSMYSQLLLRCQCCAGCTQVLDVLEDWLTARSVGYQRIDGSVGAPAL